MFGEPISLEKSSQSSMARSGSASRMARGVNSCTAAVRMLSCIGAGWNRLEGIGLLIAMDAWVPAIFFDFPGFTYNVIGISAACKQGRWQAVRRVQTSVRADGLGRASR